MPDYHVMPDGRDPTREPDTWVWFDDLLGSDGQLDFHDTREEHKDSRAEKYAYAKTHGNIFTARPVAFCATLPYRRGMHVTGGDGWARTRSDQLLGEAGAYFKLLHGTAEEAETYALGANVGLGDERSIDDELRAACRLINHPVYGKYTSDELFQHFGVTAVRLDEARKVQRAAAEMALKPAKCYTGAELLQMLDNNLKLTRGSVPRANRMLRQTLEELHYSTEDVAHMMDNLTKERQRDAKRQRDKWEDPENAGVDTYSDAELAKQLEVAYQQQDNLMRWVTFLESERARRASKRAESQRMAPPVVAAVAV